MGGWDVLNCDNHPDRIALERCEVCGKPLCAYCLYYTADGQRLCAEHAEQARRMGVEVEEPAAYAEQLIGAQAGMVSKRKRTEDDNLYRGNSNDLTALIGLLIGVISLGMCCGAGYCLPVAGFVLSLVAVINAKEAHDPRRTRKFGLIGMLASGVWVVAIALCVGLVLLPLNTSASVQQVSPNMIATSLAVPSSGSSPTPTATRTPTPTPTSEASGASAMAHPFLDDVSD
jgi:hypothetical protein